jgi:toxin ParE1/3/4
VSRVRWTPQAADDLQAIRDFFARDSEPYAAVLVRRLVEAVDVLEEFPRSGRRVPEHSDREDLRELVRPPFRIVYRLSAEVLHVVTIFHSARTIPEIP